MKITHLKKYMLGFPGTVAECGGLKRGDEWSIVPEKVNCPKCRHIKGLDAPPLTPWVCPHGCGDNMMLVGEIEIDRCPRCGRDTAENNA